MILRENDVRRSLELAQAAFPRFKNWKFNNKEDESYSGFALWGDFVLDPDETMPRRFFVTFDTYKKRWRGHLTIGQHNYFWTSANFGDANLLDTCNCETLEKAIAALKAEFEAFFANIMGRPE